MALITQLSPLSDTVDTGGTGTYTNQLNSTGASGAVTYTTTQSSSSLVVTSGGSVAPTGVLDVGTYTISGTSTDGFGNSGTWVFTLTVTPIISPQVAVTPAVQGLPTGSEIKVPFQIDSATGAVAVLTDYSEILKQHILTIMLTASQERVMLPAYGFGLEEQVFEAVSTIDRSIVADDIKQELSKWEPAVNILNVTITNNSASPNEVTIQVQFSVVPFNSVNGVTVTVGGTTDQVSSL
jgi:phage baseplate assembly protein W